MKRGPLTQRQSMVRMWVGVTAGAASLAILAGVVGYGYTNGVFS